MTSTSTPPTTTVEQDLAFLALDEDPIQIHVQRVKEHEEFVASTSRCFSDPEFKPTTHDLCLADHFESVSNYKRELRSMEFIAYANVVSAYRGAGPLTPEKSELLSKLRESFNIPLERHFSEIKRVANDCKLEKIASEVTGQLHTSHSWITEGYMKNPNASGLRPTLLHNSSSRKCKIKYHDLAKQVADVVATEIYYYRNVNGVEEIVDGSDFVVEQDAIKEEPLTEEDKVELKELLRGNTKSTSSTSGRGRKPNKKSLPKPQPRESSPDIVSFSQNQSPTKAPVSALGSGPVDQPKLTYSSLNDLKYLLSTPTVTRRKKKKIRTASTTGGPPSPSSDSSSDTMSMDECINEIRIGISNKKKSMGMEATAMTTRPEPFTYPHHYPQNYNYPPISYPYPLPHPHSLPPAPAPTFTTTSPVPMPPLVPAPAPVPSSSPSTNTSTTSATAPKRKRGRVPSIQNKNPKNSTTTTPPIPANAIAKPPVKRRRKPKESNNLPQLPAPPPNERNNSPPKKYEHSNSGPGAGLPIPPLPASPLSSFPRTSSMPIQSHQSPSYSNRKSQKSSSSNSLPRSLSPFPNHTKFTSPSAPVATGANTTTTSTPPRPAPYLAPVSAATTTTTTSVPPTPPPLPTPTKKRTQNLTPSTYTPMAQEEPVILTKLEAQRQEQAEHHQHMQLMKKTGISNNSINPPVLSHHQPIVIQQLLAAQAQQQQQQQLQQQQQQQIGSLSTLPMSMSGGMTTIGPGNPPPNTGKFRKILHPHILSSPGGNKRGLASANANSGTTPALSAPRLIQPQTISITPSVVSSPNVQQISSNYIVVHKNNNNTVSVNSSGTIPIPTFKPLNTPCLLPNASTLQQLQVIQGTPGSNNTINVLSASSSSSQAAQSNNNPSGTKAVILRRANNNLVYVDLQNNKQVPIPQHLNVHQPPAPASALTSQQQIQRIINTANIDPSTTTRIIYQQKKPTVPGTPELKSLNITKGPGGVGIINSAGGFPLGTTVVTSSAPTMSTIPIPLAPKKQLIFQHQQQPNQNQQQKPMTTVTLLTDKLQETTVTTAPVSSASTLVYTSNNNNNNNRTMFTVRIDNKSIKCPTTTNDISIKKFNVNHNQQFSGVVVNRSNNTISNSSNNNHFEEDEVGEEEEDEDDDEVTADAEEEGDIELIDLVEESSSQESSEKIPLPVTKSNDDNINGGSTTSITILTPEVVQVATKKNVEGVDGTPPGPPPLLPIELFVDSSSNSDTNANAKAQVLSSCGGTGDKK